MLVQALFSFSPLIWTYAVGAEVFALNNMFAALLVYILLRYTTKTRHGFRVAMTGAFVCGLALCNQHTIILFELPIVCWVLWTRRTTLWGLELVKLSAAFLAGLLPYVSVCCLFPIFWKVYVTKRCAMLNVHPGMCTCRLR